MYITILWKVKDAQLSHLHMLMQINIILGFFMDENLNHYCTLKLHGTLPEYIFSLTECRSALAIYVCLCLLALLKYW